MFVEMSLRDSTTQDCIEDDMTDKMIQDDTSNNSITIHVHLSISEEYMAICFSVPGPHGHLFGSRCSGPGSQTYPTAS
jgi:hypothetical protein